MHHQPCPQILLASSFLFSRRLHKFVDGDFICLSLVRCRLAGKYVEIVMMALGSMTDVAGNQRLPVELEVLRMIHRKISSSASSLESREARDRNSTSEARRTVTARAERVIVLHFHFSPANFEHEITRINQFLTDNSSRRRLWLMTTRFAHEIDLNAATALSRANKSN